MGIKVKLREKKISEGRQSLYLDFYPAIPHPETGEPTRREFSKMYLFDKPKDLIDKQHNKETLQIAEQIRQKRENHLNKPEIYTGYEKEQLKIKERGEQNFVSYFKSLADKRKASNHDNWVSAYNYLETFTKGTLKFADLNEKFLEDFKEYILTTKSKKSDKATLSQNSAVSYFNMESNHNNITAAISNLMQENGRMPSKAEIATKTELSRQHLKEYTSHPLYLQQVEQFRFMTSKVLAKVFQFAVNGDTGAAKLYFNVMGFLNNGQSPNSTLIQNQNNFIQINGTVLSQETIKNLNPEQLNTIESILKTALPKEISNKSDK